MKVGKGAVLCGLFLLLFLGRFSLGIDEFVYSCCHFFECIFFFFFSFLFLNLFIV